MDSLKGDTSVHMSVCYLCRVDYVILVVCGCWNTIWRTFHLIHVSSILTLVTAVVEILDSVYHLRLKNQHSRGCFHICLQVEWGDKNLLWWAHYIELVSNSLLYRLGLVVSNGPITVGSCLSCFSPEGGVRSSLCNNVGLFSLMWWTVCRNLVMSLTMNVPPKFLKGLMRSGKHCVKN